VTWTFAFAFHNLKGETGATGPTGPQGPAGPTHRQYLTHVTFAADMATFSYLNLIYLFCCCTNLASVSGLGNISGVRSMRFTFASCAFTEIDFRGFDPSTLTDLFCAFSGCNKLTTIYADSTWVLPSSGITGSQCFYSCSTSKGSWVIMSPFIENMTTMVNSSAAASSPPFQ